MRYVFEFKDDLIDFDNVRTLYFSSLFVAKLSDGVQIFDDSDIIIRCRDYLLNNPYAVKEKFIML